MSDIKRFVTIWGGGGMMPARSGDWVLYDDHRAEVERLTEQVAALTLAVEQADEMKAHAEAAAAAEEAETDRVTAERDAAQLEVERLKNTLFPWDTYDRLKNANEHLKEDVAKLTVDRDAAQAEVERLTQELEGRRATNQRIIAERDLAQGERERLQDLLRCERQELSTLRERLRVLQANPSAQNLDMANGQAILDSSRPDDETIWREAFMAAIQMGRVYDRMTVADLALAEYRKRWPR